MHEVIRKPASIEPQGLSQDAALDEPLWIFGSLRHHCGSTQNHATNVLHVGSVHFWLLAELFSTEVTLRHRR
jgi:hypothetical protein